MRLRLLLLLPILLIAPPIAVWRFLSSVIFNTDKAWQIAVGFDQLANVAANGEVDETISSRAGRAQIEGRRWGCVLCKLLDYFETDHCAKSIGT